MTVLNALAILEAAVSECTHRKIDTPEVERGAGFSRTARSAGMVDPAVPLFSKVGFSKSWKPGKADNRRFAQRSQEPGTRSKS